MKWRWRKLGLKLWPILQITKWEKHAFQKNQPPVLKTKTAKVSEKMNSRKTSHSVESVGYNIAKMTDYIFVIFQGEQKL